MTPRPSTRLAWLDALRGFAALLVVLFHLSLWVLGNARHGEIMRHLDLGKYGVLLFFLVSGYVIPMSLERHGDLRKFWIGRLFRIYPAYLAAIALAVVLAAVGWLEWQLPVVDETVTAVLAHATMMPELVGHRGMDRVIWTLGYEMTFYLVVAGLFVWGLHKLSAWWASGLALLALLAGPSLPDDLLGASPERRRLTAVVLVLLIGLSLVAYIGKRFVLLAGAAGLTLVLLPVVNGHATKYTTAMASWQGLLFLAVMFSGTVIYRWQEGQIGRVPAVTALTVVALSVVGAHWAHWNNDRALQIWIGNTAAVGLTFLAAYAIRNRTVPSVLTWLGRISYSLYLFHPIVLSLVTVVIPHMWTLPFVVRAGIGVVYLVIVFPLATLMYHMVELPGQRLGKRVGAWVDRRLDPVPLVATPSAARRVRGGGEREPEGLAD